MIAILVLVTLTSLLGVILVSFNLHNITQRLRALEGDTSIPRSIILKPLPRKSVLEDVDPTYQTIKDIMESAKLENWSFEIEEHKGLDTSYRINISNHNQSLFIRSRIRFEKDSKGSIEPIISFFNAGGLSIDDKNIGIRNDIILFLWDYIVKYHEDQNKELLESYKRIISNIQSNLKTLNRDRKLKELI